MSKSPDNSSNDEEEIMSYGILDTEEATTADKLEKYTGTVNWRYLKPHYDNEALLYIDPTLSLTEVGEALANDDAEKVAAWKKTGDIVVPSKPHADYWEDSESTFQALVVSPFVLIQPSDGEETEDA